MRVTHIYRREEGSWKLIHRHGDAITEKIEPAAVAQQ
jgi:ketosteroid isomerase-like protein